MEEHDGRGAAVIRRWERDLDRRRAKAEASQNNFKKTFAELLKQEEVKRRIAADASAATKDPNRIAPSRDIDALRNMSVHRSYYSDEVITGQEEWLKD